MTPSGTVIFDLPCFSVSIIAAWQVVEKLKDINQDVASFDFDLIYNTHEGFGRKGEINARLIPIDQLWFAQFGCTDDVVDKRWGAWAKGPTASIAICRAGLKGILNL